MKVIVRFYEKEKLKEMKAPKEIMDFSEMRQPIEANFDASSIIRLNGTEITTKYCKYVKVKGIKE